MIRFYYLDENNQVQGLHIKDYIEWTNANGPSNRRVALDEPIIGVTVSTVFLGIDVQGGLDRNSTPICFETMISCEASDPHLRDMLNGVMSRYTTWEEAIKGHADACRYAIDTALEELDDD